MGTEADQEEKKMKRKFAKLSKKEREKAEATYHAMRPEDLDETMSAATHQSPPTIRLPSRLVEKLKAVAEREGEADYKKIVRTWIEERLRQQSKLVH
jgi:hypothetical protein